MFKCSVITPTLPGRESMLSECISSVESQTYPVLDHLVDIDVDRVGPGPTRNRLAEQSKADWFVFLDDDDLIDPDHIEIGSTICDDSADIVYTWCRVDGSSWCPNRLFRPRALRRANYIPVTAFIRADLFLGLGGFMDAKGTRWWGFEDWAFWLKALKAGARFQCVPEVTWTYRRHEQWEHMINVS